VTGRFHLIVSSMTLHHVPDTAALFREWYDLLHPGGVVAFVDLDKEDGSFHGDRTGVHHFGFDRARLTQFLYDAGFRDVRNTTATTITKDIDGEAHDFSVFLITAWKDESGGADAA
jgi:SAM-dependent methyltransferase